MLDVQLTGVEQLARKFNALSKKAGDRAARRALRKGGAVIRTAARRLALQVDDPKSAASIAKNIAVQAGSRRREAANGGPSVRVGVMGGARSTRGDKSRAGLPGKDTTHWRHVEFGTSKVPARSFLRAAAAQSAGSAIEAITGSMNVELDKEIAKL